MKSEIVLDSFGIDAIYTEEVGRAVSLFLRETIYRPLMSVLDNKISKSKISNSMFALLLAIHKGKVSFYRGKFTGKFNAKISKELIKMGAKWSSKKGGAFLIPKGKLSTDIQMAIKTSETEWLKTVDSINKKIDDILGKDVSKGLSLDKIVSKAVLRMDQDFEDTIKGITVAPKLTEKNIKDIAENYTENMRYHIQGFADKEVMRLRERVADSVFSGRRYEALASDIRKSYGVGQSKSIFLARQETNLLLAKFKESRYNEIGVDEYDWQTVVGSAVSPVRDSHKRLNGTRQRFSDPPVVNERGDRKNPGEDWGCRCRAKAVIRF